MVELSRFEDRLYEDLRDPKRAASFLKIALEQGGIEIFLDALHDVMKAQEGGVRQVAANSGRGRESLYKSITAHGNPRIRTVDSILAPLGLRLDITVKESTDEATGERASQSGDEAVVAPALRGG